MTRELSRTSPRLPAARRFADELRADPDYADRHELHAWPISYGDVEDARTARWIAERLNHDPMRSALELSRLTSAVHNVIAIARKELSKG